MKNSPLQIDNLTRNTSLVTAGRPVIRAIL